jgi:hypothetical protein
MIRLRFYTDVTFENFLSDVEQQLGTVPGTVHEATLSILLTQSEYENDAVDLVEMVRDYGGTISHTVG